MISKSVLIVSMMTLLMGCEGLKRITEGAKSYPPSVIQYGDPHIVTGITTIDRQTIEGIPIEGRRVTVKVKIPEANEFRELNKYEFKLITNAPLPSIGFSGEVVIISETRLLLTGKPSAPRGTKYIIKSEVIK